MLQYLWETLLQRCLDPIAGQLWQACFTMKFSMVTAKWAACSWPD